MKCCVVGLSGGVDSAVSALIMQKNGYDVIGCVLKMQNTVDSRKAIDDAFKVAKLLNINVFIIDCVEDFRQHVEDYFINAYKNGITPNPCIICNDVIKFKYLNAFRQQKNADLLVTGHYARLVHEQFTYLYQAKDKTRDQSYFLYAVEPKILQYTWFPLYKMTKDEVRQLAINGELFVAKKPDSQDICFVHNNDYVSLVTQKLELNAKCNTPGFIKDITGNVLGQHKGIVHYTIGQRKKLGLSDGPFFVYKIDLLRNEIIVSRKEDIEVKQLILKNVKFINDSFEGKVLVKIRSSGRKIMADMMNAGTEWIINLIEPEYGSAKGQHCVFYDGEQVLGGGEIC